MESNNNSWGSGVRFVEERKPKRFVRLLGLILIIFFSASIGGILGGYYVKKSYITPNYNQDLTKEGSNLSQSPNTADIPKNSITKVSEIVGPAVVGVDNNGRTWGGGTALQGSGSGIIFDKSGYIVTNHHVIEGANSVSVTLSGGKKVSAKIIGGDSKTDIAVLKIDAENLPVAKFGDSSKVRVGDTAIAIGNPLGQEFAGSVTTGVISALNRTINTDGKEYKVIQTDASINPGNSGGALCNEAGEVIGINTLKLKSAEGMSFAIPINEAKPIIEALIKNGYVSRPTLGIGYTIISPEMSEQYNIPIGAGIQQVNRGGAAEAAGIKVGDIMTHFDGKEIKEINTLGDILKEHKVGDEINAKIWRDGRSYDIKIKVGDSNIK